MLPCPIAARCNCTKLTQITIPHDRIGAMTYVQKMQEQGQVATGLLYVDPDAMECHDIMETTTRL